MCSNYDKSKIEINNNQTEYLDVRLNYPLQSILVTKNITASLNLRNIPSYALHKKCSTYIDNITTLKVFQDLESLGRLATLHFPYIALLSTENVHKCFK